MQFLLFLTIFLTINADLLNEFTADVDYYDMGIMGRGKNAGSWHHSFENQVDIFYYLAMQPWRHLVWTSKEADGEYYKFIINEDASTIPTTAAAFKETPSQDYCRKEYATEIKKYEIDWSKVPKNDANFETADVNGETCYKYPAKLPLVNVYLDQKLTAKPSAENFKICRMEFIGGRSITFRSFNQFSAKFIDPKDVTNGYMHNKTKCLVDVSENNLDSDLSIVLGISDKSIVRDSLKGIRKLADLKTIKTVKLYFLKGEGYEVKTYETKEAFKAATDYETFAIQVGNVDDLINIAKNDMVTAMAKISGRRKGTIVVLMDRSLASDKFDAETSFDRNGITVHVVGFNSKSDSTFTYRASKLLSLGDYYHEFTASTGLTTAMNNLFKGIRANLTERCDRTKCNGFCDGRDRCTCPMCCENDCFYTYCDVDTATCTPWPKANPKKKIECPNDCVGDRVCEDLVGCVITRYNDGCAPPAKCLKPYCNETTGKKCKFEDTCGKDLVPSSDGFCYSYVCDEITGMCVKDIKGKVACPEKTSLCEEYYCTESLECKKRDKVCVKTSPYIEMECYEARCNERTGQCENKLSCDKWTGCAAGDVSACRCDSSNGFKCTCQTDKTGFCTEEQVCDTRWEELGPICIKSDCNEDLYRDSANCRWRECNNQTDEAYWEYLDCTKYVKFQFEDSTFNTDELSFAQMEAKKYCLSLYSTECDGNDGCKVVESDESKDVLCGSCVKLSQTEKDGVTTVTIGYKDGCETKEGYCSYIGGKPVTGVCDVSINKCYYPLAAETDVSEFCAVCVGGNLECPLDSNYRTYSYNDKTGKCSVKSTQATGCQVCKDSGKFESNCGGNVDKEHRTSEVTRLISEKVFTYTIPRECKYNQCIPKKDINCMPEKDDGSGIYQIWQLYKGCNEGVGHADYVTGEYHYSDKFDIKSYAAGGQQSQEFLDEAEQEAYCTWTMKTTDKCSTCDPNAEQSGFSWVDNCPREQNGRLYICEDGECITDPNVPCPTRGCTFRESVNGACQDVQGVSVCDKKEAERKSRRDAGALVVEERFAPHICVDDKTVCDEPNKETESTCSYGFSNDTCIKNYNDYLKGIQDFGCYKPVPICDEETYRCRYEKIEKVEDDVDYFLKKSGVVKNNKCYGYQCVEYFKDGKWTHEWKLREEFIAKQNPQPRHKCETVVCDPLTGEPKYTDITCDVNEQFPTLGGNQSECFYCQCSYTDGSFVLSMFADDDKKTYSLDACGSCIVTDRETGKILNDVPECILKQELNLTGAIAGATVAASVVFALVGAMAVVSIGLFQTYQLVTSALKNAITTTVENAEFVAADNEATNVLNAGD